MNFKKIAAALLIAIAVIMIVPCASASDTLTKNDFKQTSFSKSIDYFDYVRNYTSQAGITAPSGFNNWHANVYMNYINTSGIQLLYAGLENISTSSINAALNIPMQSFLLHYKTGNNSDALLSSTFLMLMSFQEDNSTVYVDSPDRNDALYASFSLGFDFSSITNLPLFNSKTAITPLTHSSDNLQWSWGMSYTNLTALWYRTWVSPNNETYNSIPLAITTYDELTFTYNLNINPTTNTVTLQENHVIGRMRDLIVNGVHYNSTGEYGLFGFVKLSDQTIYDWIGNNNFKMSIINYQTSVVADRTTHCSTASGQTINGTTETAVSDSSINTYTDTNEKIFTADFGSKQQYKLYNYTADPTESTPSTYDSNTRTALISSYAGNTGLLAYQIKLASYLPFTIYHMTPGLYSKVKDSIANMSRADYFYIITYPTYSGFKVDHDPTFTAYATLTPDSPSNVWIFLVIIAVIVAVIAVAVVLLKRNPKQNINPQINP